jgi:hypothetical protein
MLQDIGTPNLARIIGAWPSQTACLSGEEAQSP